MALWDASIYTELTVFGRTIVQRRHHLDLKNNPTVLDFPAI